MVTYNCCFHRKGSVNMGKKIGVSMVVKGKFGDPEYFIWEIYYLCYYK